MFGVVLQIFFNYVLVLHPETLIFILQLFNILHHILQHIRLEPDGGLKLFNMVVLYLQLLCMRLMCVPQLVALFIS